MISVATQRRWSVRVEVFGFAGCPNVAPTLALIARLAAELNVSVAVERIDVADAEDAAMMRFLGSPSVRVNGHDIEPGTDQRTEFSYSCRTYPASFGRSGVPDEAWARTALLEASQGR